MNSETLDEKPEDISLGIAGVVGLVSASLSGAAAYKADLTNTIVLCNALNNPQHLFKSIHIAGTNGKGSTSHMLAAMLQQQGYKTGLYTSPHIKDFRERIKINGQKIEKQFVVHFTENIKTKITEIQHAINFFKRRKHVVCYYLFSKTVNLFFKSSI